jgi:hypothetical protein
MIDPDLHSALQEYRDKMECPMEDLAVALWGVGDNGPTGLSDGEIVEVAARKIILLKKLLVAAGFNEKMLTAVMEE